MRRLVHQHAAAFGVPAASPGVGPVIRRVAPAIHGERTEHRPADLAGVDRILHSQDRLVQPPLADHAELDRVSSRGRQHRVAVLQAGGQRLLDQHVDAGLGRVDRRLGVQRVRRADQESLDIDSPRASATRRRRDERRIATRRRRPAGDRRRKRRRTRIRPGTPGPGRGSGRPCRSRRSRSAPGSSASLIPESTWRSCAAGTRATRPSRPCRSCRPRC